MHKKNVMELYPGDIVKDFGEVEFIDIHDFDVVVYFKEEVHIGAMISDNLIFVKGAIFDVYDLNEYVDASEGPLFDE
jgi:dTDP-D-glucose 4,6-dehydratase